MLQFLLISLAMAGDRPAVMPYQVDETVASDPNHDLRSVDLHLTRRALAGSVRITVPRESAIGDIVLRTNTGEVLSQPRFGQRPGLRVGGAREVVVRFPVGNVEPEALSVVSLRIDGTHGEDAWHVESVLVDVDVPPDGPPPVGFRRWFATFGSGSGLDGMWTVAGAGLLLGPVKVSTGAALHYTVICRTPNPRSGCDENLGGLGPGVASTIGGRIPVSSALELVPTASYLYVGGKAGRPDTIDRHQVGIELSIDYVHRESKHHRGGLRQFIAPGLQLGRDVDGTFAPDFYFRFGSWFPVGRRWAR